MFIEVYRALNSGDGKLRVNHESLAGILGNTLHLKVSNP